MPAHENRSTQAPPPGKRPMRHGGCAVFLGVGALLAGLFVCVLPAVLRHIYLTPKINSLSPADQARLKRMMSEPLRLPAEWQRTEPFSPQTKQCLESFGVATERFCNLWYDSFYQLNHEFELRGYRALNADELSSCAKLLHEGQTLLKELAHLTSLSDYNAELFCQPPGMGSPFIEPLSLWFSSGLLRLQACQALRSGDWESVLTSSLVCRRLIRCHSASATRLQEAAIKASDVAYDGVHKLAVECPSTPTLVRALDHLNRLGAPARPDLASQAEVLEAIGLLRAMKREGYPVDLSVAKPLISYQIQLEQARDRFASWKLSRLSPQDPDYLRLQGYLADRKQHSMERWMRTPHKIVLMGAPELRMVENMMIPNNRDYLEISAQTANAHHDLVRLELAARLLEAEGQSSATLSGCLKRYLPDEPVDPFSGAAYRWDACNGRFYSVGPDGKDDGARLIFDPKDEASYPSCKGDLVLEP